MAKLDFYIHGDYPFTDAEAMAEAIRQFVDHAEEFFGRVPGDEIILESAGCNLLRAYAELGKQVGLSVVRVVDPVDLDRY